MWVICSHYMSRCTALVKALTAYSSFSYWQEKQMQILAKSGRDFSKVMEKNGYAALPSNSYAYWKLNCDPSEFQLQPFSEYFLSRPMPAVENEIPHRYRQLSVGMTETVGGSNQSHGNTAAWSVYSGAALWELFRWKYQFWEALKIWSTSFDRPTIICRVGESLLFYRECEINPPVYFIFQKLAPLTCYYFKFNYIEFTDSSFHNLRYLNLKCLRGLDRLYLTQIRTLHWFAFFICRSRR